MRESSAFSRPLEATDNSTDFMIYGNIRRIVQEVLDQLDETELEEYGETAEPFVDPLEAFLLGVTVEEDLVTVSAVITFGEPTDAPTPELAAASTSAPTAIPAPIPTAAAPAPTAARAPAPTVTLAPFRVGVMESLTGPGETYGSVAVQAKQMAVDEINAAGGINGRMLELIVEDSKLQRA